MLILFIGFCLGQPDRFIVKFPNNLMILASFNYLCLDTLFYEGIVKL